MTTPVKGFFRTRSLMVTSTIVISCLFLCVISILLTINYGSQKRAYMNQFQTYGIMLGGQVAANEDLVGTALSKLADKEGATDQVFTIMQRQIDAMIDHTAASNAYILAPAMKEQDGKRYATNVQANRALMESGWVPGYAYEMPERFSTAWEQAMQQGWALTPAFDDAFGTWITYLAPVRSSDGTLLAMFGIDFNYADVKADLASMLWQGIGISAVAILLMIALTTYLIRLTLKPLKQLVQLSKLAAEGDLTVQIPVTTQNEIGLAATSFNQMIHSLHQLVEQVQHASTEVKQSSGDLQESAGQIAQASQEVSDSIQHVAASSGTQLRSSEECQHVMQEITVGIQRIAESSSVVSELAADTTQHAASGNTVMGNVVTNMQAMERNVTSAVGTMHDLQHASSRIGDIIAMIGDVANQTNLLALNASIEAARAGEHGRGFAVVAHEIRVLAERSRMSSSQIEDILKSISTRTAEAVDALERMTEEARSSTQVATEAGQAFQSIVGAIQQVSDQIQEVSAASEQMSAGSEQIAASLEELQRIAAQSSSETERVAAASEEQLASMEEVASSAEQLREMAATLSQVVGQFRI